MYKDTRVQQPSPGLPVSFIQVSILVPIAAALASLLLIAGLRFALPPGFLAAAVDHRSNHAHPARQIGGLGAVPAAIAAFAFALWLADLPVHPWLSLGAGVGVLWVTGLADDYRPLGAALKLLAQLAAAAIVVIGVGLHVPFLAFLPAPAPQIAAAVVLVWFVNMVNFMDGMDLITPGGAGPAVLLASAICLVAAGNGGAWLAGVAISGALAGFAFHNRPPAPVFLGDSGSLPLGLAAGTLALTAAETVSPLIALLPFAVYLADTLTTLARRILEGKNPFLAHSEHAYQVAKRVGMPVLAIVGKVTAVTIATGLAALAAVSTTGAVSWLAILTGWAIGIGLVVHLRSKASR